jgi:hypothetical protein
LSWYSKNLYVHVVNYGCVVNLFCSAPTLLHVATGSERLGALSAARQPFIKRERCTKPLAPANQLQDYSKIQLLGGWENPH